MRLENESRPLVLSPSKRVLTPFLFAMNERVSDIPLTIAVAPASQSRASRRDVRVAFLGAPQRGALPELEGAKQRDRDFVPVNWDLDAWIPSLAPSSTLLESFSDDAAMWLEFCRRYRRELNQQHDTCERLRRIACQRRLVLVHGGDDREHKVALALKEHLRLLECQRRWNEGWVVGGHTFPIRHQI